MRGQAAITLPVRGLQDTIDKLERGHALSRMSELTPASWAANQAR